ncbi:MAG: 50S ribosomal protein L25 [Planctomycetota bacterium]|jgi:large subunit ribosomal protein L25|nr:50S ribosomal protein L25 [Planctomycetota bacterium]
MVATLKAGRRESVGKYEAFKIRAAGGIPGVVYGKSLKENIHVEINLKEFQGLLKSSGRLIDLEVNGNPLPVLIKAVQHGTYEHEILHTDFRAVSPDEIIEVELEIILGGESPGVAVGGMLEQNLHHISARCLPRDLPENVRIDVGALNIGDVIYARELAPLPGVEFIFHGNPAVVSCRHPKGEEAPAAAEEIPAAPEVIGEKEREAKAREQERKE